MSLEVKVVKRKVKRVRLEFGLHGLKVILPINYKGEVSELLTRHKVWIAKRAKLMESVKAQAGLLTFERRTEVELQKIISGAIFQVSLQLGKAPLEVKYRSMKARWGSCSKESVVTFNKKLKFLPEHLIYYVVVHELVHLKHLNHSKQFWGTVSKFLPNHKDLRRELKLFGFALQE